MFAFSLFRSFFIFSKIIFKYSLECLKGNLANNKQFIKKRTHRVFFWYCWSIRKTLIHQVLEINPKWGISFLCRTTSDEQQEEPEHRHTGLLDYTDCKRCLFCWGGLWFISIQLFVLCDVCSKINIIFQAQWALYL